MYLICTDGVFIDYENWLNLYFVDRFFLWQQIYALLSILVTE